MREDESMGVGGELAGLTVGQRWLLDSVANGELVATGAWVSDLNAGRLDAARAADLAVLCRAGLVRAGEHGPALTVAGVAAWYALHPPEQRAGRVDSDDMWLGVFAAAGLLLALGVALWWWLG